MACGLWIGRSHRCNVQCPNCRCAVRNGGNPQAGYVEIGNVNCSGIGFGQCCGTLFLRRCSVYDLVHWKELFFYGVLGVIGAFVALLYSNSIYFFEDIFDRIKLHPLAKPALGGLLIGGILLFLPQVQGVGYDAIEKCLTNNLELQVMAVPEECSRQLCLSAPCWEEHSGILFLSFTRANLLTRVRMRWSGWLPYLPVRHEHHYRR